MAKQGCILKNGVISNIVLLDDEFNFQEQQEFLELPAKKWIGDFFEDTSIPTNGELSAENKLLKAQVSAMSERNDFMEECIAEMATLVYTA